jgi:hypothetical protein
LKNNEFKQKGQERMVEAEFSPVYREWREVFEQAHRQAPAGVTLNRRCGAASDAND